MQSLTKDPLGDRAASFLLYRFISHFRTQLTSDAPVSECVCMSVCVFVCVSV